MTVDWIEFERARMLKAADARNAEFAACLSNRSGDGADDDADGDWHTGPDSDDGDFPENEDRIPAGWWIMPAIVAGVIGWWFLIWWLVA